MKTFQSLAKFTHVGQKVRIMPTSELPEDDPLLLVAGQRGTVERIRISDGGAFVKMGSPPPESLRLFPEDDPRGRHILLYPEDCEAE